MTVFLSLLVMGIIGGIFGLGLAVLDKTLKVHDDPLVEEVTEMLPGINCGACGKAGCVAYAKHVVNTKDMGGGCLPAGDETNEAIAKKLGLEHIGVPGLKLIIKCSAGCQNQVKSFEYRGPKSCAIANVSAGNIDCKFGCMALGDCVTACPVDALTIVDCRVEIDNQKCIDCGSCVKACPRGLFQFADIGKTKEYYVVNCNNPEDAMTTKKACRTGCIGCGICIRLVEESPFYLEDKISRLNYAKAKGRDDLDVAVEKCPVKIIKKFTN